MGEQEGYPAFTVTDSAFLRADHYHELSDRPENLDYPEFAKVVYGIRTMIRDMSLEVEQGAPIE